MTLEDIRNRPTIRVEECAAIMGISRTSAYEAIRQGELPALRLGRRLLVPTARLLAMLEDPEKAKAPVGQTEAVTDTDINQSQSPQTRTEHETSRSAS